ncbi:MAG: hypothetical protein HFH14_02090 [Lachnospiraceae bacterium]|nr:hypothetical protein [Lachnospiraceae bacterium]
MPWCPKCKNEYREGITICSDCNAPLVDDLSEAVSDSKSLVFTTEHKEKTDDFIKYLAYSGIHSYSVEPDENEFIWSLYVAEEDYKKASKLFTGFALTESERAIEKQLSAEQENDADVTDESVDSDTDIIEKTDIDIAEAPDDIIMPDSIIDSEDYDASESWNANVGDNDYTDGSGEDNSYTKLQNEEIQKINAKQEFEEIKKAPSTTYVRKSDRAKEYRFSSYSCLLCGAAGIIFILLNMFGILNIVAVTFTQYVLLFVFAAFSIGGIALYFNSKSIESEAGDEESLEKSVVEWLNLNVTEAYLSNIHDDDTPEEVNYFKYCEVIKDALSKEFTDAPASMLDALIDEHLSKIC